MKTNKVITQTSLHSIVEHCFKDMSSKILNLSNGCKHKVVILKFCIYTHSLYSKYTIMIYLLKSKGKKITKNTSLYICKHRINKSMVDPRQNQLLCRF